MIKQKKNKSIGKRKSKKEIRKHLISFCTLAERDEIKAEDMKPWIGFVYTFPEYRGNRCSEKIIKYTLEEARNAGYKHVYISSNEIGLYEKYGFEFINFMKNIYGQKTQVFAYDLFKKNFAK